MDRGVLDGLLGLRRDDARTGRATCSRTTDGGATWTVMDSGIDLPVNNLGHPSLAA
ncbi:MAG: hypothetical protein U0441_18935 [Polyangiaceae bacterium]